MASVSTIGDYFGSLVHPGAAADAVASARHRSFIVSRLIGGILAFAALPLILLIRGGAPAAAEIAVLAWLTAPILAALDLSRTGNLERAHFLSAASLSGLILAVATLNGGAGSFALIWLPVVVFEAASSGSRRVLVSSVGVVVLVLVVLLGLDVSGMFDGASKPNGAFYELSALLAVFYAAALTLRWHDVRTKPGEHDAGDARYRLLAENMSDLVTRHSPGGAVVFASAASARLLGVEAFELEGRGLFERVHIGDRPTYLKALSDASRGGASCAEFRVRGLGEDGEPRFVWVEMRCNPVNGEASPSHVVAVTREISERKEQEGTLERACVEADRANAAKGHFLASVSHELRTPLNAIIGFSEILANGEIADMDKARRQEYAALIHDSGLHLLSVVNGILDMSRIESGNFAIVREPFALKPVIDNCLQLFELKAGNADVKVSANIREDLPDLSADKRACKQIMINLLSNAIKFTPAGGEVRVSAYTEAEMLRIEVADTGVGIAEDDLPQLGNCFFQARSAYDRPYEGTGLGLSVVKGLVGLHGGSFDVRSKLNEGTCVVVRLPRERVQAERNALPETEHPMPRPVRRTAAG